MGKVPLDQLVEEENVEVEWKAFELRPEGVEIPPKSSEYVQRAKAGVEAMSKQYGLDMKWNDKSKHSRHALEGAKYAEEQGFGNEYHDVIFAAQFQQNEDINDMDTLVRLGAKIGLDGRELREVLKSRKYRTAVLRDHQEAMQLGITGIPCFVSGDQGVMGAQDYDSLKALVNNAE
ncbi:DsbA family oxidoreductase [Planococcus lenghuensis]|uniref:DsbA family oxidoreductase n=1 Tax=Planococcus lenghuensis TaxID=2213202 RepID=UPI0022B5F319|nr:DsbA family protein [Planococcus lenghuensis]